MSSGGFRTTRYQNTLNNMKSTELEQQMNPPLLIASVRHSFIDSDVNKLFWRVEYQGILSQYLIRNIHENGEATFKIANLTDLRDNQYKLKDDVDYWCSSTFGIDIIINKPTEFFTDFQKAKEHSLLRYDKEVNPNGKYRVARYFDDIFETYETGILDKKSALNKASELNKQSRHYVSYGAVSVNCA
jgi:hypothetical protein